MHTLIETYLFVQDLDSLPADAREQVTRKIHFLQQNPGHNSLNTHVIKNSPRGRQIRESYVDRTHYRIL